MCSAVLRPDSVSHYRMQSLGCTIYALAYARSPFELTQTTEQGGSIAMAVLNTQYKYPDTSKYSQGLRNLIDSMLKVEPKERPGIHEVKNPVYIKIMDLKNCNRLLGW